MNETKGTRVRPHIRAARPGVFEGEILIHVHSLECWNLIYFSQRDNEDNRYVGLLGYAGEIKHLWDASAANDPFADWYLDITAQAIGDALEAIREINQSVKKMIQSDELDFSPSASSSSSTVELTFGNMYGYIGARLVIASDNAIRSVHACLHTGLLSDEKSEQYITNIQRIVLRALNSYKKYSFRGLTREDGIQKNVRWNEAVEVMGNPPEDIVKGRRAKIAPRLKKESIQTEASEKAASEEHVPTEELTDPSTDSGEEEPETEATPAKIEPHKKKSSD